MCVSHVCLVAMDVRRGCFPWDWSHRCLWATMWMLGMEPRSSVWTVRALNLQVISLASVCSFLTADSYCVGRREKGWEQSLSDSGLYSPFLWWFEWEWPSQAHRFEYFFNGEWPYLKGLGGMALLEEVCHWEWTLRLQTPTRSAKSLSA